MEVKGTFKMKKLLILLFFSITLSSNSQTLLTEANDFNVKTIDGLPIFLFPILDDSNMIVVIDFFSTTCGPCQDYAPDFQQSYEDFGSNNNNVYFMGINWGSDNQGVWAFDSIYGLTYPTASGTQGGGNIVFNDYQIQAYPTVIVIKPDHFISNQHVWYPTNENINEAVIEAGGILVGEKKINDLERSLSVFPNPAQNEVAINITLDKPTDIYLDILNSNGQIVFQNTEYLLDGQNSIQLDISIYKSGIYFLRMISTEGIVYSKKLIIRH